MGVSCDEYIILTASNEKTLKKIKRHAKDLFNKSSDLKRYKSCIGKIGGGMNGHYSLVIVPTGWNGGYGNYEVIDKIKDKIEKINFKAESFNEKNKKKIEKGLLKRKSSIHWNVLSFTDWGITFESHDEDSCPELKWASNLKVAITPKSGEYDLSKEEFQELIDQASKLDVKKEILKKLKAQFREKF